MNLYPEIKEIAEHAIQMESLLKQLKEKNETLTDSFLIDWSSAEFVTLTEDQIKKFRERNSETGDYFTDQHQGICEDWWWGDLWFKTDIPGQYVKVPFET